MNVKLSNLSFKKHAKATGLGTVGYSLQSSTIKANKKDVGTILAPNWQTPDNAYRVQLRVLKSENEVCRWKLFTLKKTFESEEAARAYLKAKWELINKTFTLVPIED